MVINATLLKNASLIVMSVYPALGRVAFMPGNGAGEIPGPPPEIASDFPGPGAGGVKRPGSRPNRGRDPGRALINRSQIFFILTGINLFCISFSKVIKN